MTPVLLWALDGERMETLSLFALPIDKLAYIYVNSNRDPGEKDQMGNQVRPPAPEKPFEMFRTFRRRKGKDGSLAAKDEDSNWDSLLMGAQADKEQFAAWALARAQNVKKITQEVPRGRIQHR